MKCLAIALAFSQAGAMAAEGLPDPTRPSTAQGQAYAVQEGDGLHLESVMLGSGAARQFAIINGQRYQVGQMVGAAKLVKLLANAVVLQEGGKLHQLQMYPGIVKQPPQAETKSRKDKLRNKNAPDAVLPIGQLR